MPVIDDKYKKLVLANNYVSDPLLLALAWKKAQSYIRTANWYADNFELDTSAIDLPNRCSDWASEVKSDLVFKPMELVPAPKGCNWGFTDHEPDPSYLDVSLEDLDPNPECLKWQPIDLDKLRLRPLAHIGIREQSIMTLVMMCLANDVETDQGDPATHFDEVHKKKVVSYGNRLYCKYEDEQAEHSFGATTVYSKYFADYRQFLHRSYHFAGKELAELSGDQEVYLVELDLTQFFDLVDRDALIEKIEYFARRQKVALESGREFITNILEAFRHWDWSDTAKANFDLCKTSAVPAAPSGIPQGLVAGGFLANIYLSDFDRYMADNIAGVVASDNAEHELKLTDYCRYVDDMRLVVVGPNRKALGSDPVDMIKSRLNNWVQEQLQPLNLKLNPTKTKVEIFRGKAVGVSATMEGIQSKMSGPVPFDEAGEYIGQLESLLTLTGSDVPAQVEGNCRVNRLAAIEKSLFDVREDTLKRFAANKISNLLSKIRHFTARETDDQGRPTPGDWDYLQERLARRFIAAWSREPSLVLLLKKGLELFPSSRLLSPVLEQLIRVRNIGQTSSEITDVQQSAIANYCLAEIFRHSATIIHRKDLQAFPAHADIDAYFEELQQLAVRITMTSGEKTRAATASKGASKKKSSASGGASFDFLADQARFLLLVRLDTTLEQDCGDKYHDFILKLSKGFREISLPTKVKDREIATCVLIASQLVSDQKTVLRATASLLETRADPISILELLAIQDAQLFRSLILHARPLRHSWVSQDSVKELIRRLYIDSRPSAKPLSKLDGEISIYKLMNRPDNPLANEIMALKLMQALVDKADRIQKASRNEVIDLVSTKIKFSSYSNPPSPAALEAELSVQSVEFHESIATVACHLQSDHGDTFVLQRIALCIRGVLAGSVDATGFGQSIPSRPGYRGLKSTQYKRQIGLMTTPESLAGESAQFSGWLTTLLSKLLRWPGIHVNNQGYDWPVEFTIDVVKKLVESRLERLRKGYCKMSGIPSFPELVNPNWPIEKSDLIVAMVQSKMPYKDDFAAHGHLLDDYAYRTKHRRHVARVANLLVKHIEAQNLEELGNGIREQDIDLIVWPELSVHKDDLDVLIALSRKTHAIIFAGLSFINQNGIKGPNNCAVWIVPRKHNGNQSEVVRFQGKHHMMEGERAIKIQPWRPYQLMIELVHPRFKSEPGFVLTGSICFDATDINLSADLRDKSNALLIPALNRDVNTFDSMVEALHYHMFQHVVLVNTGEFGGSYAMAPYDKPHKRSIAHSSGNNQVSINTFQMNMFDFRRDNVGNGLRSGVGRKMPPAGVPVIDR